MQSGRSLAATSGAGQWAVSLRSFRGAAKRRASGLVSRPSEASAGTQASSFSRGISSSEVCFVFPPRTMQGGRSADRRSGAAAPVGGPVMVARRRSRGALRPMTRDVRLSALHRGILGSGPARDEASEASPSASSSRPLVVAEGSVSGASREHGYEPRARDAASRSASGSSPETPCGERDGKDYSLLNIILSSAGAEGQLDCGAR
jgi:hypothetical protein